MLPINHSFMPGMPELAFGSVWLVSAGDGDPGHLSPLAEHAISTADAAIHDPEIPGEILDLVKPPRYREAAVKERAIERSIKLAQDGWRVAYILGGDAMVRAIECASRFAEHSVPFRVATVGEPLTCRGVNWALPGPQTAVRRAHRHRRASRADSCCAVHNGD